MPKPPSNVNKPWPQDVVWSFGFASGVVVTAVFGLCMAAQLTHR